MVSGSTHIHQMADYAIAISGIDKTWDRAWKFGDYTVVFDFRVYAHRFALDVIARRNYIEYSVVGRTEESRRILRSCLVGKYPMIKNRAERHVLEKIEYGAIPSIADMVQRATRWIDTVSKFCRNNLQSTVREADVPEGCINLFWWDLRPNFGDAVGPWLAHKITGLSPVNGRGNWLTTPPIAAVGSIAGALEQDGTQIWGTGLMVPLREEAVQRLGKLRDVSVKAVRGKRTRDELVAKLGWEVPEVYGDPALLLPRYLPKEGVQPSSGKVAVVPHYSHVEYFSSLTDPRLHIVDVETGLETVVQEIAAADACISTSLHGIIIAQAYGVPWTWLRVEDHPLGGDTFKFEDFFSTLDKAKVHSINTTKSRIGALPFASIALQSSLPRLEVSLDLLEESFPHPGSHTSEISQVSDTRLAATEAGTGNGDTHVLIESVLRELTTQSQLLKDLVQNQSSALMTGPVGSNAPQSQLARG